MGKTHPCRTAFRARRQRGQAGILVAALIALVIVSVVISKVSTSSTATTLRQAEASSQAMAQVKEALIAWSASRTPAVDGANARPGELPCPDINPLDGYEDGSCVAGALGRVPWKTLGIEEPKDGYGETLWYSVDGSFRKYNNITSPITSDTRGIITVHQDSSTTTLSTQAVAVIFAPGAALNSQDRSTTTTMACSAPSGTVSRNVCASNYLESTGGVDNARISGPFVQASSSDTFNDRLTYITNADLMPAVEQRVARELISYLNRYRAAIGVYPWADLGDGNSNASSSPSANYYNRNRFPCGTALPAPWSWAGVTLPNWLTNGCGLPPTGWQGVIYYAAARNRLDGSGASCTTCSASTLTVTNASGRAATQCSTASPPVCTSQIISSGSADLVLITVGARNVDRGPPDSSPNDWPTNSWTTIASSYIADSENADNINDTFVVPSSTANNRNRFYVVR
jgi:hypothetical protein